jgi:hypothetical protein
MVMRFGMWDVRSLYMAGLLNAVSSELAKYNLDLGTAQEVRLDNSGSQPGQHYTFFCGNGSVDH